MQLHFKEKITLIGFVLLCPQIFAEASLGKVFKHDAPSGKVEVVLQAGRLPTGTVWIDQETGRIPCVYVAIFHTKYVCTVERSRSVKKGAAVFFRQAADSGGEKTVEIAANFQGPFFEIYKPDDWQYEQKADKHMFTSSDGGARWELQFLPRVVGNDACSFAVIIADSINSQSLEYLRNTKSTVSSPELARVANADEACYGVYEINSSGSASSFVVIVYTAKGNNSYYLVTQYVSNVVRKLHSDTLLKVARSFRLRPVQ